MKSIFEKHQFEEFADAIKAGYTLPNRKLDTDTSGDYCFAEEYINDSGNRTVSVWFTEGRRYFKPMYPPSNTIHNTSKANANTIIIATIFFIVMMVVILVLCPLYPGL